MEKDFRQRSLEMARGDEDSTAAKILRSAEKLFAGKGYERTTTRDIVEAAGVTVAMLHYYWGSKEELYNAVVYDVATRVTQNVGRVFEKIGKMEPREAFRVLMYETFSFMADTPGFKLLLEQPKGMHWAGVQVPMFEAMLDYIEKETGLDFSPVDAKMALFFFVGAHEYFFVRPDLVKAIFDEDPENLSDEFRRKVADNLCTMFERFGKAE